MGDNRTNRKSHTRFRLVPNHWPWMTLNGQKALCCRKDGLVPSRGCWRSLAAVHLWRSAETASHLTVFECLVSCLLHLNLSLDKHVTSLSAKCFFQLRQRRRIRRSLRRRLHTGTCDLLAVPSSDVRSLNQLGSRHTEDARSFMPDLQLGTLFLQGHSRSSLLVPAEIQNGVSS